MPSCLSPPLPADIISTVEFNHTGELLATGDKGGRVVIFQREPEVRGAWRVGGFILQGASCIPPGWHPGETHLPPQQDPRAGWKGCGGVQAGDRQGQLWLRVGPSCSCGASPQAGDGGLLGPLGPCPRDHHGPAEWGKTGWACDTLPGRCFCTPERNSRQRGSCLLRTYYVQTPGYILCALFSCTVPAAYLKEWGPTPHFTGENTWRSHPS